MNKNELPEEIKSIGEIIGWLLVAGQAIFTGMLILGSILLFVAIVGWKTLAVIVGVGLFIMFMSQYAD